MVIEVTRIVQVTSIELHAKLSSERCRLLVRLLTHLKLLLRQLLVEAGGLAGTAPVFSVCSQLLFEGDHSLFTRRSVDIS